MSHSLSCPASFLLLFAGVSITGSRCSPSSLPSVAQVQRVCVQSEACVRDQCTDEAFETTEAGGRRQRERETIAWRHEDVSLSQLRFPGKRERERVSSRSSNTMAQIQLPPATANGFPGNPGSCVCLCTMYESLCVCVRVINPTTTDAGRRDSTADSPSLFP